jgi:hypothetical protein
MADLSTTAQENLVTIGFDGFNRIHMRDIFYKLFLSVLPAAVLRSATKMIA